MTETSLLLKIAREAGLDFSMLVEEMLKEAIERGQRAEHRGQRTKYRNEK